ncbi:hypothetical protein H0H87_000872 [Tephrocybe sp. NHM501043]|nr:hypothetical protein H0H87_000872 [Tephrocybe sp. NHM501043]
MSPPRPAPPAPPPSPISGYIALPQPPSPYPSPPSDTIPPTPAPVYAELPPFIPSPYPSPPDSNSTIYPSPPPPRVSDTPPSLSFHPLLQYSQNGGPALIWDLCRDPTLWSLRQATASGTYVPVPEDELLQPATAPPVPILQVSCGIAPPFCTWGTITVNSPENSNTKIVTVFDVLSGLRRCMETRLTQQEWDALSNKQKERVNLVFDLRWHRSETPTETRANGVLRQDCLLQHTLWAGLTSSVVEEDAAVLTLRRLETQ